MQRMLQYSSVWYFQSVDGDIPPVKIAYPTRISIGLHVAPDAIKWICHIALGGSHMVNRTMMQILDATNTSPVNTHSHTRWNLPGFMIRFNNEAIASFGVVNAIIPSAKSEKLISNTSSKRLWPPFCFTTAACEPYPRWTFTVVTTVYPVSITCVEVSLRSSGRSNLPSLP